MRRFVYTLGVICAWAFPAQAVTVQTQTFDADASSVSFASIGLVTPSFSENLGLFDPAMGTLQEVRIGFGGSGSIRLDPLGIGTLTISGGGLLKIGGIDIAEFDLFDERESRCVSFVGTTCVRLGGVSSASDFESVFVTLTAGVDDLSGFIGTGVTSIEGEVDSFGQYNGILPGAIEATRRGEVVAEVSYVFSEAPIDPIDPPDDPGMGGGPTVVPLPASGVLLFAGLLGLRLLSRRAG